MCSGQARRECEGLIGWCAAYEADYDLAAQQRTTSPVVGYVAEHAVFDLVPLAGARREVTDLHRESEFISQMLQLQTPQGYAVSVAAAAVSGDQQAPGPGVHRAPYLQPPAPNALHREL